MHIFIIFIILLFSIDVLGKFMFVYKDLIKLKRIKNDFLESYKNNVKKFMSKNTTIDNIDINKISSLLFD